MKTLVNTAAVELLISVIIGLTTVYITKILVMYFYLKKTNESNPYKNLSFMIFLSATIFSVSYIVFGIMEPLSATIKIVGTTNVSMFDFITECIKYLLMFLVLGYSFSIFIIFITYKLFSMLTGRLDEYDEILKNNIGVAILVAVLLIVVAMFTKTPFISFVESFIPYPKLPTIL